MEPPPPDDDANRKDGGYVFVLELATLETAKVGKGYAILNCDDHANFIRRHGKQPGDHRPDICHQALLAILDSPLNKAGMVKAIYVNTQKNVLFRVSPKTRVPRTFKRFCGLMVQLLQKLSVRSSNGPEKLMQVVKQPVTKYFPAGARRVGFSFSAPEVKKLPEYVEALPEDAAVVFTIGAMAHGKVDVAYTDDFISVSRYPLSAACCIGRICNALELKHDIVRRATLSSRVNQIESFVRAYVLAVCNRNNEVMNQLDNFPLKQIWKEKLGRIFYPGKRVYQYVQRSSQPFGLERIKDLRNSSYVKIKIDQGTPENQ